MNDEELLALNRRGFIPGPGETEEHFVKRVQLAQDFFCNPLKEFEEMEKVPVPHWDWVRHHLKELYDFQPDSLVAYYSNRQLTPWQGAASWVMDVESGPLCAVQLRRGFLKGSYLGLYSRDEILAHEAVHAARCAFEEPAFEEFFAYYTSSAKWRRLLGPIIRKPWEASFFLGVLGLGALFGIFLPAAVLSSFGFLRLGRQHTRLWRAVKKMRKEGKSEKTIRFLLFRLTDCEIKRVAQGKEIGDDQSLRSRLIRLYNHI
jgi:hypothetical protein